MSHHAILTLIVVYLVLEVLLHVLYVGKHIEITGGGAVLTIVTHGLMIWGIVTLAS